MARVFISYCTPQRPATEALADFFAQRRCSVWWDRELHPNQKFQSEIQRQLRKARAVVVIWSCDSIKSEWVLAEAEYAWRKGKLVNAHMANFPPGEIPTPFRQVHAVPVADEQRLLSAVTRQARSGLLADAAKTTTGIALLGAIALALQPSLREQVASPEWTGEAQTFIGKPLLLTWKHEPASGDSRQMPSPATTFEIENGPDERFATGTARFFVEGHYRIFPEIADGAAHWRIRAVDPETREALSAWSPPRRYARYSSVLRKISATGKLNVLVSLSEYKDMFKWTDEKNILQGFEARLAEAIARRLPDHAALSGQPQVVFGRTAWPRILEMPATGKADMILSGISKRRERELKYGFKFTDTYFCTPHSIVTRAGELANTSLAHLLQSSRLGYQELTTSEILIDRIRKSGTGTAVSAPKTYGRPEIIIQDLISRSIDVALTDLQFAVESSRKSRIGERALIEHRAIGREDVPDGIPDEVLFDEYSIAVIDDLAFWRAINGALADLKSSGELLQILHKAAADFEDGQGRPRGSLTFERSRAQPWQCQP